MKLTGKIALWIVALAAVVILAAGAWGAWVLKTSEPRLDGTISAGVGAPVTVARDAMGVPTITAASRADAAYALGYLHGQERFFEMDGLRRAAAGELGALFGASQLDTDRKTRVHRFRAKARAAVAAMSPQERAMLDTYTAGVNKGLADLRHAPFEYAILMGKPAPWTNEDTALVVYAMYLDLQGALPDDEMLYGRASDRLGPAMAAVLYPRGSELDSAIDGSRLPDPPLPAVRPRVNASDSLPPAPEKAIKGSNNWAISGAHTATGAAMLANDMHLGLGVPNIWYRARIKVPGLDITGVTLPGTPIVTAGSNGKIAWGYTDSYIDFHDAVLIEPAGPGRYKVPGGTAAFTRYPETLCAGTKCDDFPVEETIWGPVVATDARGRKIAMRWTADDPGAVAILPSLALERASSVAEAVKIAHAARIPQQNFVVADSAGNIAWTIIGRVPKRFGLDGRTPESWADGSRKWDGYYADAEVPVMMNPANGRLWSANSRVVGGKAYAMLGDGFGDNGSRALRIEKRLKAKDRFAEADLLSIQLDDTSERNIFWQAQMLAELEKRKSDPALAAMIPYVRNWGGRALPSSVGYRLVARYRAELFDALYTAWLGKPATGESYTRGATDGGARLLLRARPANLVPPGYASWDALIDKALKTVAEKAGKDDGGDLARYTWGDKRTASIGHPLAKAIPLLHYLTDPKDEAVPGDSGTVRAAAPGFGASERFVVSPGHEQSALFHMPGGQAGNPWSPYYLAGHEDWVKGRPAPFLPGKTKWTMVLRPAP